jgi:DNA-binding IclR family transcriptional regulator
MKPYTGTQAVVRALRLLRLFENAPELTSAEVLERSGLNRTTAFRLLTALASEGMVALDPEGERYRLGPAVALRSVTPISST